MLKLKPKVKALGFNTKELKGIAAKIADNLTSAEDASDEDVNADIDTQIEAVLPYLSFGQSQANRLLDEWKKKNSSKDDEDDSDDDDDPDDESNRSKGKKSTKKTKEKDDDVPEWVKGLQQKFEELTGEIATLKGEKVTETRRSKLGTLLKDTGTFGKSKLRDFAKMKFENDEDFDEYFSNVESDLTEHNQELADKGLSKMGAPHAAGSGKQKEELLTDAEIDAIVESL